MSGVKTTVLSTPPTAAHQAAGLKLGFNVATLTAELAVHISEAIVLLREIVKTFPNITLTAAATISTSSPNITTTTVVPATVVAGMTVSDVTNGFALGVVADGIGSTTLTLAANAAHAGSTGDIISVVDPNLATYTALLASLA